MISHLFLLGAIQATRAVLGCAAGGFLIFRWIECQWPGVVRQLPAAWLIPPERLSQFEPGDRTAFLAAGIVLVAFAVLRGVHAFLVLRLVGAARMTSGQPPGGAGRLIRRMGLALAILDLVDITLFPVTTACGTYGLLVYRHPDIRDFFEGTFQPRPPAGGRDPQPAPAG